MARYVWKDGDFRDPETGAPMQIPERDGVQTPMIMTAHFQPYRSCVTGKIIDDRGDHREEIAAAKDKDLVPFERVDGNPGGLINKRFAARSGRRVNDAAVEWAAKKRAATAVKTDASGAIISE